MLDVRFRHAVGREDSIAQNVPADEAEEALQLVHPGATLLSVEDTDPPRSPDHPEVAARRRQSIRDHFLTTCRRMLERQGVDYGRMEVRELVEAAAPHFGSDRAVVLRLYRDLWDETEDELEGTDR